MLEDGEETVPDTSVPAAGSTTRGRAESPASEPSGKCEAGSARAEARRDEVDARVALDVDGDSGAAGGCEGIPSPLLAGCTVGSEAVASGDCREGCDEGSTAGESGGGGAGVAGRGEPISLSGSSPGDIGSDGIEGGGGSGGGGVNGGEGLGVAGIDDGSEDTTSFIDPAVFGMAATVVDGAPCAAAGSVGAGAEGGCAGGREGEISSGGTHGTQRACSVVGAARKRATSAGVAVRRAACGCQ